MKFIVTIEPNTSQDRFRFDTEDYGITDKDWKAMTEQQRRNMLQEAADQTDKIYPLVDTYEEVKE